VYYLGVLGELGSFLSEIKKSIRDGGLYTGYQGNLSEELGDMFWYVARLASFHHVELRQCDSDDFNRQPPRDEALFELASSAHSLVDGLRGKAENPQALFAKFVASIQSVCTLENLKLEAILERNSTKTRDTWSIDLQSPAPLRDEIYPEFERLPRVLSVQFVEVDRGRNTEVIQRVGGIAVGDRLTDNAYDPDGYRYHDSFHLGYAACLGWSPVARRMLRAKRKTNSRVDEVDDGARAAIIEEAIASLVFNYAREHSWLEGLDRVDQGLLKHIQQMVRGLEVQDARASEWQHAILSGFEVFRNLRQNRGGWVHLDASRRSLQYTRTGPGE
jgi:hypothetical protein